MAAIAGSLDTAGLPDPDLIICSSGEHRLRNLFLWEAAYSEFLFLPIDWPDFDASAMNAAIAAYAGRERRFGRLGAITS